MSCRVAGAALHKVSDGGARRTMLLLLLVLGAGQCAGGAGGDPPAPTAAALLPALPDLTPLLGANFEELVKAAAATCEVLPLELLFSRYYTLELPHLELVEFTRSSRRQFRALDAAAHVVPPGAGPAAQLPLYVPGWWNTPTDESTSAVVQALLARHPRVLVLDTRLSFCRGYVSSASRVKPLAHLLYSLIKKLTQSGFPLESIHLIGFSLGAHVAGMTGKLVRRGLRRQLERITALDPAKPCFARATAFRLDRRDAKFVQVIHSSAGALGLEAPLGHADLYMNGVYESQPECQGRSFKLQCDHAQAWKMYSRSVEDRAALTGRRCGSWDELMAGRCSGNATVLGYGCEPGTSGMFLYRSPAAAAAAAAPGADRRRQAGGAEEQVQVQTRPLSILNPLSWLGILGR